MSDYNSNQASPVGVYVDEAYLGATFTHGLNFFDMERIEVLRGPQGTLYGKNTTGGAINLISRTPKISASTTGYIGAGIGNYDSRSLNGAIEGTLIEDKLAARLAFTYKKDDDYFENRLGGDNLAQTDYNAARLSVKWEPSENFGALLRYSRGRSDARSTPPRGEGRIPVPGVGNLDLTGYQRPASYSFHEGDINRVGNTKVDFDQSVLTMNYDFDKLQLISVSSLYESEYSQVANTDGSPTTNLEIDWAAETEAYSQDLRLVSDFDGKFNFILGLYYGFEDIDLNNVFRLYESPNVLQFSPASQPLGDLLSQFGLIDQRLSTEKEAKAIYGQFDYDISDRLQLTLGLRYTEDEGTLDYLNLSRLDFDGTPLGSFVPGNVTAGTLNVDNPFVPPSIVAPNDPGFYIDGSYTLDSIPEVKETERELSGKVSLSYDFSDTVMGYVSYSRGFRAGSFHGGTFYLERSVDDLYAAPEFVDVYELGFKSELLDGRMRLNGAAFSYDYKDQQFVNVVGVATFLENAASSEINGFEIEAVAQVTQNLSLKLAAGWLDAEFSDLQLANTLTPDPVDLVDLSGNELISAPKLNFSFAIDYSLSAFDGTVLLHLDGNYQDDQFYSAYNDEIGYDRIGQEGYWLFNTRVGWRSADETHALSLWGKNLADEEYDSYAINLQSGFGYDYFLSGTPRQWGLDFTYNF